ncbi:uncharacterized protein LOC133525820 [Cydia pomonella]|uniref:uncharacterized protein LOC133525820 n=1 Tax=Cydia pomonella TaxID=82600 RepID=UPI002ADDFA91|nr:uncharacterized protein LOC133525820 [Cydia pomonella]
MSDHDKATRCPHPNQTGTDCIMQVDLRSLSDLRIQYNNAFRALLRLPRWCCASGMFADARIDGFQAIMRARCVAALRRLRGSRNSLLAIIADRLDSQLLVHWTRTRKSRSEEVPIYAVAKGRRGRPVTTWLTNVRRDMKKLGLSSDDAYQRSKWRLKIRKADPA